MSERQDFDPNDKTFINGFEQSVDSISNGALKEKAAMNFINAQGEKVRTRATNSKGETAIMIALKYTGMRGLETFLAKGAKFNSKAVSASGRTEAMFVAQYAGVEGVKAFVSKGGRFNPEARTVSSNQTEAMFIVKYTDLDTVKSFLKNGGQFNPRATDINGTTEFIELIDKGDRKWNEGQVEDIFQLFTKNGGKFSADARNADGELEAMVVARTCGKKGIELYAQKQTFPQKATGLDGFSMLMYASEYGGKEGLLKCLQKGGQADPEAQINRSHRQKGLYNEVMVIAETAGLEGLRLYTDLSGFKVNPDARNSRQETEIMVIARTCGMEGLKHYLQQGAKVNYANVNAAGVRELKYIWDAVAEPEMKDMMNIHLASVSGGNDFHSEPS